MTLSPEQAGALSDIGRALIDLGGGLQRLASAAGVLDADVADSEPFNLDAAEVERLWERLGKGNRHLLIACARKYTPGESFTLEQMAEAADAAPGSVKARLMNIGRSLKSMGNDFTVLWDSEWALINMTYSWRAVAHSVIVNKAPQ
jgi:hypothetical protein